MTEKEQLETDLRMAERYIGEAKLCLFKHYDDYADIQRMMHDLETVRQSTETLLSKFLNGKLK